MSRHWEQIGNGRRVRTAHNPLSSFLQTPHRQGIEWLTIPLRPATSLASHRCSIRTIARCKLNVRGTKFNVEPRTLNVEHVRWAAFLSPEISSGPPEYR